jgi:AcrR family transcriptional regulator
VSTVVEQAWSGESARPRGRDTREKLLVTAERLFAQRGIDAVSLREILEEAEQRNKSAPQYYFGGKDGLVTALANFRTDNLNRRRTLRLDAMEAEGLQGDLRALAETLVLPMVELLDEPGNNFLGFLARYHLDRSWRGLSDSVDPALTESYRRVGRLLRSASGLSRSRFSIRFSLTLDMCFTSLAGRQALEQAGAPNLPPRAEFVDNLVETVCGIFAPR